MNPLKKGPEIKFRLPKRPSGLKLPKAPKAPRTNLEAPKFLSDLFADLRDRRLLPLVGLLLIAIVAVPILLSESAGSEDASEAVPTPATTSAAASVAPSRDIVVSRSAPPLRSYRHRLGHRSPANPFKEPAAASKKSGAGESAGSEEAPAEEPSSGGGEGGGEVTVTHEEETTVTEHQELKYFTYKIDVRVVPVSSKGVPSSAKPSLRRGLPELTKLPAKQIPALVFLQPSADGKKAVMLVDTNVRELIGDNPCVSGGETCQLLALEVGVPETIVWGGGERTYRIKLLKLALEESKVPPQTSTSAPTGKQPAS